MADPTNNKKKRCAIYAQSFTPGAPSCRSQIRAARRTAEERSWIVVSDLIVIDRSVSIFPWSAREGLERLISAVEAKQHAFDVLLVYDWSRLNRNKKVLTKIVSAFNFYDVKVVTCATRL